MFFKICRSSTADENAHATSEKRTMPSLRNPFQNHGRKAPKGVDDSPPQVSKVATATKKISKSRAIHSGRTGARKDFLKVTTQGLGTEESYSNPESLPSLEVAYQNFKRVYPRFTETVAVDRLREREYGHLGEGEHVCLDYSGFGLFSHWQQAFQRESSSFNLAYISANLPTHALYGTAEEGTVEAFIRRRILNYMNLSETDYSMVFTASRGTAYKLLAESYPFSVNNRLLTVYDYESDAVSWMVGAAKEKGAKIMNASFKWPNLRIAASDLKYKLQEKKKKKDQSAKGLFVFPVQSRVTGAKYSYQWISQAQANKWHVLLDASALAPKDMDSLALSLFRPEFIVTSFYKVFGADPTGFGCLFIKNSTIQSLHNSDRARGVGMVRIIPTGAPHVPLARGEGLRGDQHHLPDIHEIDTEEFIDAADFVDPVSSFSGPLTQLHIDPLREKAILDLISGSGKGVTIAGFDDSSGRTSLPSENEEEWDDRMHGECLSGLGTSDGHRNYEDFVSQEDFSGRENDHEVGVTEFGTGEIQEELDELVFPLTRRAKKLEGHPTAVPTDSGGNSAQDKEGFSFDVREASNTELMEGEFDAHRVLETREEVPPSKGDSNRFLSRIQEEEPDECDDISSPHQGDSQEALDISTTGNGLMAIGSPLFHSPPESTDGFEDKVDQDFQEVQTLETVVHENKGKLASQVGVRSEADKLESNIMFRDDRNHVLREGRDVDSFFEQGRTPSFEQEDFEGGHYLGSSGANGRRLQSWSPGEGSSQWEAQYAMSEEGSPIYLDDGNGDVGPSNADMLDEEGPVVCNGLDHADSQGLNKTNLRLRFLINWLINALLKLRHPAQLDKQGTNLVHIYGPEVHFDRGPSVAFNVFDWNGVPVRTELVQRLADRNNISLGLGTLCNIVYPEGSMDLAGLWSNKVVEGGTNDGKAEPPRASNASKHERDRLSEIPVVTATLGFVSTFEDVYRLWAFVAKFLDADFVKREEWRYHSLNQEMIVL